MSVASHPALPFAPADILLPRSGFEKWACIACDQFTSDPAYWADCDRIVGGAPSTLRLILPELYLGDRPEERTAAIRAAMEQYLADGVFAEYPASLVFVERTQPDGRVRRGIVGAVDLEAYDYHRGASTPIRATEGTVLERIPPRVRIREGAPLESPHIMILIDDPGRTVIEPLTGGSYETLYDFDLMQGGGHLRGSRLDDGAAENVLAALDALREKSPLLFAMGDGNHSLATAKACYEAAKERGDSNADTLRWALCEIVNIHDEALDFEPIYRVLKGADPAALLRAMESVREEGSAQKVAVLYGGSETVVPLAPASALTVGSLQNFLDGYLKENPSVSIDYIHDEAEIRRLVAEGCVGFLFDGMTKDMLFPSVIADGVLPRKTFSMGVSRDKRYYMECRRLTK